MGHHCDESTFMGACCASEARQTFLRFQAAPGTRAVRIERVPLYRDWRKLRKPRIHPKAMRNNRVSVAPTRPSFNFEAGAAAPKRSRVFSVHPCAQALQDDPLAVPEVSDDHEAAKPRLSSLAPLPL